jgi:transcriptional regulator of heat shock response
MLTENLAVQLRTMAVPPEITFEEFRQLVEMLKITIAGMSELGDRVSALEDVNNHSLAAALALKESQQQLYEAFQAQQQVNALFKQGLDNLLAAIGNNTTKQ